MKSISNMQNDCEALSSCVKKNYPGSNVDYCTLKEFDGENLARAISCSPFLGTSGFISFNNRSNLRETLPINLFQIQANQKVVKIGNFTDATAHFFGNEYFFGSSEVPISGKNSFFNILISCLSYQRLRSVTQILVIPLWTYFSESMFS